MEAIIGLELKFSALFKFTDSLPKPMSGLLENLLNLGYIGVFVFSLAVNLVPFLGPSNLVVAGGIASSFPSLNPLLIGLLIAFGSSTAKTIHFGISYLTSNFVKSRKNNTKSESKSTHHRSAMLALFLAAASPIPDEPIVIPLGLARYSPLRFFISFFAGKSVITIAGAYLGQKLGLALEGYLSQEATIIFSVILTIVVIVIMIEKDKIVKRLKSRSYICSK
ncbi:VTT domain-containing protein [Candidatus Bathyarchaeota archaeon]|nr:VTT domain-containing protein [Candidatus Bathyarchaeota archaeon]